MSLTMADLAIAPPPQIPDHELLRCVGVTRKPPESLTTDDRHPITQLHALRPEPSPILLKEIHAWQRTDPCN
jgi:hypothetical protein